MNFLVKNVLIATAAIFFSCSVFADAPSAEAGDSFLFVCIDSWMKKSDKATDQVDFKNFGEKYCSCASTQPLGDEASIKKAIQLCMSRTLLHDTMDSVEEEIGLTEAKDTDIDEYCQDRWSLIYPNQTAADKQSTTAYCQCATPKLVDLIKHSETITDKQYDDGINSVAEQCSGNVKEEQPTANTTQSASPANTATPH